MTLVTSVLLALIQQLQLIMLWDTFALLVISAKVEIQLKHHVSLIRIVQPLVDRKLLMVFLILMDVQHA